MHSDGFRKNRRILVIDDQEAIHGDFMKILGGARSERDDAFSAAQAAFLGVDDKSDDGGDEGLRLPFDLAFAFQGQEGCKLARQAAENGRPFAAAFVDMRMPPGWDGLETIAHLWEECPDLQVVICTAFSDYSWEQTARRLGCTDRLLILKKPFDTMEVRQLAEALTEKWNLGQKAHLKLEQLAAMVEIRTRDLERARNELLALNEEMARARDAAENANRSKSEFLASMSHEIRTPATAIVGYADLVSDPTEKLEQVEQIGALKAIKRNAEFLLEIINDILDISKIEAGRLEVHRAACSPAPMLQETVALLAERAGRKGLKLSVTNDSPVPAMICTDAMRVKQIVLNLVGNAIKFTSDGEINIIVGLRQPPGGEPLLAIEVRDTGVGMSHGQTQKLFKPYSQADSTIARDFGGTGLGLMISRRLATLLGGDVSLIESELGKGSRFLATVATGPLDGVDMFDDINDLPPGEANLPPSIEPIPAHVLVAEDGPDNQRLISLILRRVGAEVTIVSNGRRAVDEALRAVATGHPYDVILMDMQMPIMDGRTAIAELRKEGYRRPIIALTAESAPSDQDARARIGCDDWVNKPFDRRALVEVIRRHINKLETPTAAL